jgi:hypothetical protein
VKKTEKKVIQFTFPFLFIATIILLILKVCKIIEIDWAWVFSPLWIPAILTNGVIFLFLIILAVIADR